MSMSRPAKSDVQIPPLPYLLTGNESVACRIAVGDNTKGGGKTLINAAREE
jgi:hypothetical protein